jgi:hypothetical protein
MLKTLTQKGGEVFALDEQGSVSTWSAVISKG